MLPNYTKNLRLQLQRASLVFFLPFKVSAFSLYFLFQCCGLLKKSPPIDKLEEGNIISSVGAAVFPDKTKEKIPRITLESLLSRTDQF